MNQSDPFPLGGRPRIPTKKEVANIIALLIQKYRHSNTILPTEQLTVEQVDVILDGIKDMIYQHEELPRE